MGVATKPFVRQFKATTPEGYVMFNGEQMTRVESKKVVGTEDAWEVTFYFSDGYTYTVSANDWTRRFTHEIFIDTKPNE
jgi:hypothetical protein